MMKKGDALGVPTIREKPPLYDKLNSGGDGRLTRHRCGHPRRGRRVPSGPRPPNAQRASERIPGPLTSTSSPGSLCRMCPAGAQDQSPRSA